MPYRRLPNTDQARFRALQIAIALGKERGIEELAFSQKILAQINAFLPRFEKAHLEYREASERENSENQIFQDKAKKARMYVSHFFQVFNLAIVRGEIKPENQAFYEWEEGSKSVPDTSSDADLVLWGQRIIEGEQKRISMGGTPMYNPSAAKVKVHYEVFKERLFRQQIYRKNSQRLYDIVNALRCEADALILSLWNEIEEHFEKITDNKNDKLQQCSEYGVISYFRKDEDQFALSIGKN